MTQDAPLDQSALEAALSEGKFYRDRFKSDPLWHGPMRKITHGSMEMWLDQWGANYLRDGTHWGHTPESASNLDLATERDDAPTALAALSRRVPASGGEPVAWTSRANLRELEKQRTGKDWIYSAVMGPENTAEMNVPLYASPIVAAPEGWRTIDSAPKDGKTHILAYPVLLDRAAVVIWELPVDTPPMMRAKGKNIDHDGFWRLPMTGKPTPYTPTHWMPVPAFVATAPSIPEGKAEPVIGALREKYAHYLAKAKEFATDPALRERFSGLAVATHDAIDLIVGARHE